MSLLNNLIPSLQRAATPAASSATSATPAISCTVVPGYEIKETPEAFSVTVFVPGAAKEGVEITAEENQVRILARRAWQQPERWTAVHRESVDAAFELVLTHDHAVDPAKVAAELRDGVLRVSLPKHEALKPRKIAVN